ncbi:MAG: hypothetical protein R3E21_05850 [Caenibius sp.]
MSVHDNGQDKVGMPRWLVIGFAIKLVLVVSITLAVVWWANR